MDAVETPVHVSSPQICFNAQWPILERLMAISGMSAVTNTPV